MVLDAKTENVFFVLYPSRLSLLSITSSPRGMLLIRTASLVISSRSLIKRNHLHPLFIVPAAKKRSFAFLVIYSLFSLLDKEKEYFFFLFCFVFLLKVFFELADKEGGEKRERLGNEKTHVHQGPRSHLINWLVKRRKITM